MPKGGAMKLGQAISNVEAALPPEIAARIGRILARLQEAARPLPARTIHRVLSADMGEQWRASFAEFDDQPTAAASIGQVHGASGMTGARLRSVRVSGRGQGRP